MGLNRVEIEMPEVLPVGKSTTFGPDIILQRPELAKQAINVCANWALIEKQLMTLYSLLMGTYMIIPPGFEPLVHPVALQIFDTLNNLRSRLDLLLRLCKWLASAQIAEKLERDIIPDITGRHRERSAIAHGVWGICTDYPHALILMRTFDGNLIYREHDFKQVSDRIVKLHARIVQELIDPIRESLRQRTALDPSIISLFVGPQT